MDIISNESRSSNDPVNLAKFDVLPSLRFGSGDSTVEEVYPRQRQGENLRQQQREPQYLLKRGFGDSISERLSYLIACTFKIPYQTVQWAVDLSSASPTRRLRSINDDLVIRRPRVVICFESGAETIVEINPETATAKIRHTQEIVSVRNPWDIYRIRALNCFTEDTEDAEILRRPNGLLFGSDLTYGFGVSDLSMTLFSMPAPVELQDILPNDPGISSTGLTLHDARHSVKEFLEHLPQAQARTIFLSTLQQIVTQDDLPMLLATDIAQSPYPRVQIFAEPIHNWVSQRQQVIASVLENIS